MLLHIKKEVLLVSDEFKRNVALVCYGIGSVLLGYTVFVCLAANFGVRTVLLLCLFTVVFLFVATYLRCGVSKTHTQRRRLVRAFLVLCCCLYGFALINLLFLHNSNSSTEFSFFLLKAPNFIPLKSLIAYAGQLIRGSAESQAIWIHILGNIALYMPLGFFLFTLFNLYKGNFYFPTVSAVLIRSV
jgi:glycopeptide antibiotics resistance protein